MRGFLIVVAAVATLGLLWMGGEMHYGNCIDAAKATPDQRSSLQRDIEEDAEGSSHAALIQRKLDGCSRLPF